MRGKQARIVGAGIREINGTLVLQGSTYDLIGPRSHRQSPRNHRKVLHSFPTKNLEETKNMKRIRISFKMVSAIALLALIAGCATTQTSTQSKESMLVASGFKTIPPKTAAQQQKLQTLPPGKIAMIKKAGKTYYVFPDAAHNQAYVGGPKEYHDNK